MCAMANPEIVNSIPESELILNSDGSVYHLRLRPEQLASTVILVGDPGRVEQVSSMFDRVDERIHHREFITHTGEYQGKRLSCVATGIGTDNVDIVLNELDALVNVDLDSRMPKTNTASLDLVRIGTTGALHADIDVGTWIASEWAIGLDGLMNWYGHPDSDEALEMVENFIRTANYPNTFARPYAVKASNDLMNRLRSKTLSGITLTSPGFYAPQGRKLRLNPSNLDLNDRMARFEFQGLRTTNFEMETSGLYGLGSALGHRCASICMVMANRSEKKINPSPKQSMSNLIGYVLDSMTQKA
ncbi:MAG: nucleoside phosphorylase [Bacteroidetes bacterium]|nr:nucleoside phosphorylase [Bacteroidota bacterium]